MQKKKILVIPSDTPHPSYIESLITPLAFLEEEYSIHTLDSLSIMEDLPNPQFYQRWQQELAKYLPTYDAFFGFSFGGVILQQCFPLFEQTHKSIILFSTPCFADDSLSKKLNAVIALCKAEKVDKALHSLYQQVYYPNIIPHLTHFSFDKKLAAQRIIFGLTRVLNTDSRAVLKESQVSYLHLIGERSHLVNTNNVVAAPKGNLLKVPDAGMRILRDNFPYCKEAILHLLRR